MCRILHPGHRNHFTITTFCFFKLNVVRTLLLKIAPQSLHHNVINPIYQSANVAICNSMNCNLLYLREPLSNVIKFGRSKPRVKSSSLYFIKRLNLQKSVMDFWYAS